MPIGSHESRRRHPARARRRRASPWIAVLGALTLLVACSGEAPLPGEPLRLVSASLPDPVVDESYQADLTPTGGLRPYTYELAEGRLPPGLALQGGTLIGTPTEPGRYEFTVTVTDANLSRTYEEYALTVLELPVPALTLAVPETEVRDRVVLRGRIEDVRGLRGARVRITWDDPALSVADEGVRTPRSDVVALYEAREDGVAVDLAVLGDAVDGDPDVFELVLSVSEPTTIGADVVAEILYSGRHVFDEARVGTAAPDEDVDEATDDETAPDVPGDEGEDGADASGDATDDAEGDEDDGSDDGAADEANPGADSDRTSPPDGQEAP